MHQTRTGVRWVLHLLAAALWVTAPVAVQALGLGTLKVHSGLDEPLNAQIELISPGANELKTLKTTLASRADFEIAGVDRAAHLFEIKYSVSQRPGGQHILKLSTDNPVREPFLHFLIQVEWSGGRLIREYSALLDPPHWVAGRPAEISVPETVVSEAAPSASALVVAAAPTAEAPLPLEELPPLTGMPDVSEAAAAEKIQLTGGEPPPSTPIASAPTSSAASAPDSPPSRQVAPSPSTERPTYTERPELDAIPAPVPAPAPVAATDEYGPVKKGDTLTHVVDRIQYDKTLTSRQVMLALLRANPSAFFDNNVNNLKAGAILKVPESETLAALPRDQAAREFRAQYDAWQEYKLKLAGASRAVVVAEAEKAPAPKAETSKKKADVTKAEKAGKDVKGKAEAVDLLKIVRANLEQDVAEESTKTPGVETKKDAAREEKVLTERVATLEEAIESKQMQNKEMRDRVGKLQDQVKNTERLIDLENKDLALAQKQAAAKQAADAKAAEEKAALEKAATAAAPAPPQPEVKPAEAAQPAAPPKPATAPQAAQTPVPPPAEVGFLDGILASLSGLTENSLPMALLGIVGVLAAGLAGLYAVRRRRASREFSESILSGSSLSSDVNSSVSDTGSQAAASDTSFLSDFSQGGMGNVHTDEVDPIAEAEVYLAYGRDEQAEEILKDAIVKDPIRQELKGKLLEIYFQRNAVGAFETLAEELYAALEGKGGKIWDKVEEMGRKLSPTNPMFRGGKPSGDASAEAAWVTAPAAATTLLVGGANLSFDRGEQESPPAERGLDFISPASADSGLDFNLDFKSPSAEPGAGALDSGLNFDMGGTTPSAPTSTSGLDMDFSLGESSAADTSSSDIDFVLPGSTSGGELDYSPGMGASGSGSDMDFNLGNDLATDGLRMDQDDTTATAEASLPGWDETATKLDLAKAYIDMGDADGARSILDEVIAEGNESQKQQARDLASQIVA